LGYDLFLDKETLKTKFITGDVFDPDASIKQLDGKIDIIHAAAFFHLFNWDGQVKIAKRFVSLLNPKAGVLVIGRQMANVEAGEYSFSNKMVYRHNDESFKRMWKLVGDETGTNWQVDARISDSDFLKKHGSPSGWVPLGSCVLSFTVRRL
jgi:hypothetical protein